MPQGPAEFQESGERTSCHNVCRVSSTSLRPERFSVILPEDGTEPYVVLPLGSIWPSHPEAAAIENLIWDSGHRDRAWGMTVSRCVEARMVAGRHASGVDALGNPVSVQVRDGARRVLKKLDTGLRALAVHGVAGAADALGEGSASSSRAVAPSGGDGSDSLGTPQRQTFVLTWNPRPDEMSLAELDEHREYWLDKIRSTEGDATSDGWWSTGSRKSGIDEGDDLVLFLHGAEGGIVASGTATSEVYEDPADGMNWIDVEWAHWVAAEDRLPVELLRSSIAPEFFEYAPRGSGQQLSDAEAGSLKQAWQELLEQAPLLSGDEAGVRVPGGRTVPEGAISRAEVNRYERSRWARAECLRHYGLQCQVCDLDFGERYGELGRGFMHVHHVTPLHEIAGDPNYRLDPIEHLRPVCPNCHAMLHRPRDRTLTVDELRQILDEAG